MYFYKIRNKDGLFSSGGLWPKFSKSGKMWHKLSQLKSHLSMVINFLEKHKEHITNIYKDCDIVEYEVNELHQYSIDIELHEINNKKK